MLTLQGPTAEGHLLLETWSISAQEFGRLRALIDQEPLATTLTDADAKVISQRFAGD